jgi:hypothetical protein
MPILRSYFPLFIGMTFVYQKGVSSVTNLTIFRRFFLLTDRLNGR